MHIRSRLAPLLIVASLGMGGCSSAPTPATATATVVVPAPTQQPTSAPAEEGPNPLPISSEDASTGPEDALVTVVLFGDIRNSWSMFLLERYETEYAPALPPNTVRFVWKHALFDWDPGPSKDEAEALAISAAAVQISAGSKAFFDFAKRAAATSSLTAKEREDLAVAVGAPRDGYSASLTAAKARVSADQALLAKLPYPGPHFYVNGASGNVRFSCDTVATIRRELARAKEALAKGTARDKVYSERVRANVANKAHCALLKD